MVYYYSQYLSTIYSSNVFPDPCPEFSGLIKVWVAFFRVYITMFMPKSLVDESSLLQWITYPEMPPHAMKCLISNSHLMFFGMVVAWGLYTIIAAEVMIWYLRIQLQKKKQKANQ